MNNIAISALTASPNLITASVEILRGKGGGTIQQIHLTTKPFARWLVQTRRLSMIEGLNFDTYLFESPNVPLDLLSYIQSEVPLVLTK